MAARNDAIPQAAQNSYPERLMLQRVFDAPRDLVWKAWTDPAHLARWWGPKGFTNPRCEWNPWPGGAIHIDMRAPDGVVYPMSGKFQEVVAPERIVFVSSALDDNGKSMFDILNTVTFTEREGKTTLKLEAQVLTTTAMAPQHLKGMEMGWTQSLDRLGELLVAMPIDNSGAVLAGDREIVATRVFDAPRDLVWKMWTMPEHVTQWWGPRGFKTTIHEMDVRAGGTWRLTMHGPDGHDYKNRIVFQEVVKPERLVFEHIPETGSEPGSHQTTIVFTAQGDKTQINFRMMFKSAAARDYVVKTYGAVEGLNQTLSRFGEYAAGAENKRG
jgi:uncharacterized protein YndB with AHSA1/START domain